MKTQTSDYRDNEREQQVKRTFLYIFQYGATLFHLTNHDQDIVVNGLPITKGADPQNFTAAQIKHGGTEQQTELNSPQMNITVGINASNFSNELKRFFLTVPTDRLDVTVIQINSTALPGVLTWGTDQYVLFRGVKTGLTFGDYQISLSFINLMLQEDGKVPRFFYQKLCQHALYSAVYCTVNPLSVDNFVTTTISALDRAARWIEIPVLAINGHTITGQIHFSGGIMNEYDGADIVSKIFSVSNEVSGTSTRIYLMQWSPTLQVGTTVKMQRGCNRTTRNCISFGNLANFGGTPYVPDSNPAIDGIPT